MSSMNRKYEAGRRIATSLFANENSLDNAIIANATSIIETVRAREAFQGGISLNQEPLLNLFRQGLSLAEARAAVTDVHASFVKIRADEGMDESGFGCQRPCLLGKQAPVSILKVA